MPRAPRQAEGGRVYHVLNRAVGRSLLFAAPHDYTAFERVLTDAHQQVPMRTLAYCVMPNLWHLVLWPRGDDDLSRFMQWLTGTHTQRWHTAHAIVGTGPLYQGRFKAFLVQSDLHWLTVCRYVEQNPLRAGLVRRAQDWRWGSPWRGTCGSTEHRALLSDGPVSKPDDWLSLVNEPQVAGEVARLRRCAQDEQPFGDGPWVQQMLRRPRRQR